MATHDKALLAFLQTLLQSRSEERSFLLDEASTRFAITGMTIAANGMLTFGNVLFPGVDANNALHLNGKVEGALNVNSAALAEASNTSNTSIASATSLLANNATNFNGQAAAFYANAQNLLTGTVATARLGSGVANSTTFLAGDQTYKVVAPGGGNAYGTIETAGQANLVAQATNAIFTFAADAGIVLTTNVASDGALHIGGVLANTSVQGDVSTAAQSFLGVKTFTENVAVSKALSIAGNTAMTGNLSVVGLSTLTGNASFGGFVNVGTTLQVTANSVLGANVYIGVANIVLQSTGAITANGALTVNGALSTTGGTLASGNVTVTGFANVSTTLQVASTSLLNGALTVNAAATVNGAFTIKSTLTANGGAGSATQVLTSGGAGANAYWTAAPTTGASIAQVVAAFMAHA